MDYNEALNYLFGQLPMFSRIGAAAYKPGLQTSEALDKFFGHPHRKFHSIHVAGTNGKGSTSHMLAAMLQVQGYKTGLYTSPHLADFRERMRVNGVMIPEKRVVEFVERFQASGYQGHPSFFELTMMMAFDWFAAEEVDFAVIEVGMGGRLDSTNIITPDACVITNISPDHMQFLGSTLEQIAAEKAGIIKSGIPVVIGEAEGSIKKVFADKAEDVGAPIRFAEDEQWLQQALPEEDGWRCRSKDGMEFKSELAGDYQLHNINTVLCAVDMLRKRGIAIDAASEQKGFSKVCELTGLAGRWMKIADTPLTIADTGHNKAGLESNMRQLHRLMEKHRGASLRIVAGFVADKDIATILTYFPTDAVYYLTNAQIPRALPVAELEKRFVDGGFSEERIAGLFNSVSEAVEQARKDADATDIIYIGGSTFVVADFLAGK